jgi:hypothetical protein
VGRGKSVEIAGLAFPTHAAFKDHVKKMLEALPLGQIVGEPQHSFLVEFVKRHPQAAEKIGVGIDHFKTLTNKNYGGLTKCFYVFRKDGTHSDFSYQKCIATPTPWEEFIDALRGAVMDQIIAAREKAFGANEEILCPLKNILFNRSVSHIDHMPPHTFTALVEEFMNEEWLQEENPPATDPGNNVIGRRLVDKEMEARWVYFHASRAQFRLISKEAHLETVVI